MHLINFSKHILIDLCRTFGALRSKRSHFVSFQMKKKRLASFELQYIVIMNIKISL